MTHDEPLPKLLAVMLKPTPTSNLTLRTNQSPMPSELHMFKSRNVVLRHPEVVAASRVEADLHHFELDWDSLEHRGMKS